MNAKIFERLHTRDDIEKTMSILQSASEEHLEPLENMISVEGTKFKNLKYVSSTVKSNYIDKNFFIYDGENGLHGICESRGGSANIKSVIDAEYVEFYSLHTQAWLCQRHDGYMDLLIDYKPILKDIESYDVIGLDDVLTFVQLDKGDHRYLLCLDSCSSTNGYYCPQNAEDFTEWYKDMVIKRGYEGKLNNLYVSALFQIYFEVLNCIFQVGNFVPLYC